MAHLKQEKEREPEAVRDPIASRNPRTLVGFDQLKPEYGVRFSRVHLGRLEKVGKFPRRVRPGGGNFVAWFHGDLVAHADAVAAEREGPRAA